MQYRMLTVSREYGSGGAQIASIVARRLGWQLLDSALIEAIAREAQVDPSVVRAHDERVDSWLARLNTAGLRASVLAAGAPVGTGEFFDADATAIFARFLIEEAYKAGNTVTVGRGGQCILSGRPDVFRVFVYAPDEQRLRRVQQRRGADTTLDDLRAVDNVRIRYLRRHFGRDWNDPLLYDLMISSARGDEKVASTILFAMNGENVRDNCVAQGESGPKTNSRESA